MTRVFIAGALGILSYPAIAATDLGCKGNPVVTGQCYQAWGSIYLSGDAALVFGPAISGARLLLVRAANDSERDIPVEVSRVLEDDLHASVTGDFEVCPLPQQPQYPDSQVVCIERAVEPLMITHGPDWQPPR